MKIFSICFLASILFVAQVGLAQPSRTLAFDEEQTSDRTLQQTLELGHHVRFLKMLKDAGLESFLTQKNVTLLIPDESYFEEMEPSVYQEMIKDKAGLREALKAHALLGTVTEKQLAAGGSFTTQAGHSVESEMVEEELVVDGLTVLLSDVAGDGFLVHVVDDFLYTTDSDTDDDMDDEE